MSDEPIRISSRRTEREMIERFLEPREEQEEAVEPGERGRRAAKQALERSRGRSA